ncbi:MAG: aminotransferase class I/II-fold pyridoxal phosphate-dependent enzyme [Candidatus Poseidoniaceae archaeon]|jgi:aspartate/methionine/tyrosine aminotransferase|nr:aminotransferase class I/II-fold pyridoxal phosphate-dependent enzyme [Candidatus Poseidoniaceae archaeon]
MIPVSGRAASIEYAIRDVVVPATELENEGHEIIKLNIGDPIAYPGLPTPSHMSEAFSKAVLEGKSGYSPSYGLPELRNAIADDEKSKGWDCASENVYVCHGVTEALQIIFAATLDEGTKVLAPGPHYPPYMAYPQMYGAETIEYTLKSNDGWSIDLEDIESKMDDSVRLLVLINPNNPTGNVAGADEIDKLIKIAAKWPNCMIIADEIYDALDFSGKQVSVASRSNNVPVFTLNGVSKVYYAPGWRIGYIAVHDPTGVLIDVRDGIERLLRSRLCASTPAQMGYLAGLNSSRKWMQDHLLKVQNRRKLCLERIAEIDGLEVEAPGGAFYMFVRLTDDMWSNNDKNFVLQLLHEEHVLVVHGSGFSPIKGVGHIRIVYLADLDTLNRAFDRIDSFLSRHRLAKQS